MPTLYNMTDNVTGLEFEGLTPLQLLQVQTELQNRDLKQKETQIKEKAMQAVDTAKGQIATKRGYEGVANTLNLKNIQAIPAMHQQAQRQAGSAPMTQLGPQSPIPQARQLGQQLSNIQDTAAKSKQDIYSEQGLTDRYSQVPEVKSYLETEQKRGLSEGVKNVSSKLASGEFLDKDGNIDSVKASTAVTAAIADYLPEEALKTIQNTIKKEIDKTGTGTYSARLMAKATPQDIDNAVAVIESLKANGYYDNMPAQLDADIITAKNNPLLLMEKMGARMGGTEEKLRYKKEAIPLDVTKGFAMAAPEAAQMAAKTESAEMTKRKVQQESPMLTKEKRDGLRDAYSGVNYLNTLKSKLIEGDLGYFDINRKTGQFTNPKAADAFLQLVEIVGRDRSGAAINVDEWKNFGKQVLNKNSLLTEDGRATAIEGIENYLDRFFGAGASVAGDIDWYNNYKGRIATSRGKAKMPRGGDTVEESESDTRKPSGTIRIGEVKNGYRFKGGNPNSQNSWEKVK